MTEDLDYSKRWLAEPPVGSVLLFERTLDGQAYRYVALRTEKRWYVTGVFIGPCARWSNLVKLIANNKCRIVSDSVEVPQLPWSCVEALEQLSLEC